MPDLIKMRRDEPLTPGGATTADVHPDEVDNFLSGGWKIDTHSNQIANDQPAASDQPAVKQKSKK